MTPVGLRHVFVISRHHPDLYEYVRERFARYENVEVVLDRRRGERRTTAQAVAVDRRRVERRCRPHVDAELKLQAAAMVTIA